jgi:hypothetical protein
MHCPRCGADALIGQPFCRSCGLNLEKVAELLAEQPPANPNTNLARMHDRQVKLERWGLMMGLGFFGVILAVLAYVISSKLIAAGLILPGVLVLLLAGSVAVMVGLQVYAKLLKEELGRARPSLEPESPAQGPAQLNSPQSVTENTTELLNK